MANIAQMVNVLQSVLLTDGPRMVRTPTYYAFLMYRPFQDATALPVEVSTPNLDSNGRKVPAVDVTAARGMDGALYVALVNVDPAQAADVEIAVAHYEACDALGLSNSEQFDIGRTATTFAHRTSYSLALRLATEFMELHRKYWPEFEGESEVRPMFDPGMGP